MVQIKSKLKSNVILITWENTQQENPFELDSRIIFHQGAHVYVNHRGGWLS